MKSVNRNDSSLAASKTRLPTDFFGAAPMTRISLVIILMLTLASMASASPDTPRDLDTHHLFTPPATRADWEKRAATIKKRILVSCGLWPMPAKTPLNPMVTGKIDAPDYT